MWNCTEERWGAAAFVWDGGRPRRWSRSECAVSLPGEEGFPPEPTSSRPAEAGQHLRREPAGSQEHQRLPLPDSVPGEGGAGWTSEPGESCSEPGAINGTSWPSCCSPAPVLFLLTPPFNVQVVLFNPSGSRGQNRTSTFREQRCRASDTRGRWCSTVTEPCCWWRVSCPNCSGPDSVFAPQVVKKRNQVEVLSPAAKRPCRRNQPAAAAGPSKNSQRSIFSFLDHWRGGAAGSDPVLNPVWSCKYCLS